MSSPEEFEEDDLPPTSAPAHKFVEYNSYYFPLGIIDPLERCSRFTVMCDKGHHF